MLGGGVVPGSVVLIGGDPGIGKSTLLLQVALEMAARNPVLYVSGEESERQIKMRAMRLLRHSPGRRACGMGSPVAIPDDLFLVTETNLNTILEHIQEVKPQLLILDSVQTTYLPELEIFGRFGQPGARNGFTPARAGKIQRDGGFSDRACHQGRRDCRASASWSISSIRCSTWKATGSNPTGCCDR